jgi:predicted amidohydrolase
MRGRPFQEDNPMKICVIQQPPVYLDLKKSIARAMDLIAGAAANGAKLVVFPEAWFPGYPTFVWRLAPGAGMGKTDEMFARLQDNAIDRLGGGLRTAAGGRRRTWRGSGVGVQRNRQRGQRVHAVQLLRDHRRRRADRQQPPQADADKPGADGLGFRRCLRAARGRHGRRADRRA